jgi:hypothetical protein
MKAVEFIRKALEMSGNGTLTLIEDMKDAPFTCPTSRGGNHPMWVLGHLAWSEGDIIQRCMLGRPSPLGRWKDLFGMGSEPSTDPSRYPAFDEVLTEFKKLRAETLKVLGELTDDDLDQPSKGCPPEMQQFLGTFGQCFLIAVANTMNHRGQVADARRAAGRPRLRF